MVTWCCSTSPWHVLDKIHLQPPILHPEEAKPNKVWRMDQTGPLGIFGWKMGVPEVPVRSLSVRDLSASWTGDFSKAMLSTIHQTVQGSRCPVLLQGEIKLVNF